MLPAGPQPGTSRAFDTARSAEHISKALVLKGVPAGPRLIRPSEHLALVERSRSMGYGAEGSQRRPPHLVPTVTVLEPRVLVRMPEPPLMRVRMPQPPPAPLHRMIGPPPPRMPPPQVARLPQPYRDIQQLPALPAPPAAPAPPGPFGAAPRTIVIQRPDARHGFGFTLRHLVVYPPDSLNELYDDGRHLAVGAVGAPMDTIFVRSVRAGGPAAAGGLRAGDRVLAVNGEPVAGGRARAPHAPHSPYARVVQLAQREPHRLRLTVVPRDHDLLQRYFSEAAYNPESNQRPREMPAPTLHEHESRLFDAYRKPRAALPALPAPQAPPRHRDDAPHYASVASLGDDRRESDASLPSSAADSKDSLGSFDSASTLTARELDDSIILSRIRKSLEQKEAFLRRPSQPTGWVTPDGPPPIKQKEFYARPQKLQKPAWPPPAASPPPAAPHPAPEKKEAEDCSASVDSGTYSGYGEVNGTAADKVKVKVDKGSFVTTLARIQETAPSPGDSLGSISNGSSLMADDSSHTNGSNQDNRYGVSDGAEGSGELPLVTARTRQLAAARAEQRTALYRSELARLSTTRPVPSVALRRREFETRAHRREARSLDAQPDRELEVEAVIGGSLSGNHLIITGSKHLHCPPPEGYVPEEEKVQMRARSNSTGSEGLPVRRHHATDGGHTKRRLGLNREQMEAMNRVSLPGKTNGIQKAEVNGHGEQNGAEMKPRAQRPTQLSLAPPGSTLTSAATTPASPSPSTPADSGFADDSVTRRQKKDAQMGEEERAMRRVSYLKATWGDRLHLDSDPELETDHHALRSAGVKKGEEAGEVGTGAGGGPAEGDAADVQGNVQVKMVVSNGKRASDRSWKQVWAVLHGPKLYLYRHHSNQSPATAGGAVSAGAASGADGGVRDALDVRYSLAALADDYTKRKHVVRVSTAAGAELLLQADGVADAQRWLHALKRHSAEPTLAAHALPADCPSPLPPQRTKKSGRNRSPTGPPTPTLPSSPKNKTWKGRMAKQLRRMHPGTAPAPPAGWIGAPLERCPADPAHPLVPLAITLCAGAVEAAGLRTVGVYRVPGNAAGVSALAGALDRGEPPPPGDPRWADVHVASSLLKTYLRRLPDALLTGELYPAFIAADRSPERARELRRLVQALPDAHYETLKYLMQHLLRVVAHSHHNKMEPRNLAIVFGPTLVRAASDDMLAMVNDMSSQCRIIESLINHYEWYFEDEESAGEPPSEPPGGGALAPVPPSRDLLIHNVKKIEGKDVSTRDIVSSIISAANRKIQRKPRSKHSDSKKWSESEKGAAPRVPPGGGDAGDAGDVGDGSPPASPPASPLASSPPHVAAALAQFDNAPPARYSPLSQAQTQERVKKFELETMAMLGRARGNNPSFSSFSIDGTGDLVSSLTSTFDQKLRTLNNSSPLDDGNIPYADECQEDSLIAVLEESKFSETTPSESSVNSEERVSPSIRTHELKAAWLSRDHRHSSSSSAEEPDARPHEKNGSLTWTSKFSEEKLKFKYGRSEDEGNDSEKENCCIPNKPVENDKSDKVKSPDLRNDICNDSEKDIDTTSQNSNGEALPDNDKSIEMVLSIYSPTYTVKNGLRLSNPECIKRNSAVLDSDGDQENSNKKEANGEGAKLKRSESLNREPERSEARVLRSESLNCRTESRLQRSESLNKSERLTKLEKTESNQVRRREAGAWRSTKLKRKNGMPERGIKRRHTVGGTKDFDKDGWSSRHTRTSSPDLTRAWPTPLVPPPRPPLESHV